MFDEFNSDGQATLLKRKPTALFTRYMSQSKTSLGTLRLARGRAAAIVICCEGPRELTLNAALILSIGF